MGLDASVRCRCFEEGLLRPGPVPVEDLYIDEEGWLSSRTLDYARERLDRDEFKEQYGALEDAFNEWLLHPCAHEDGFCCDEWISNWSGVGHFEDLVEECGGRDRYPLLSGLLPHSNGGMYPAEKAAPTLAELDRFLEEVSGIREWVLEDAETHEEVWTSTAGGSFTWMYGLVQRIGMRGGRVFFMGPGGSFVETSHFRQVPRGKPARDGSVEMDILCLDTSQHIWAFDSVGPESEPKTEREFIVVQRDAPFLFEGKYGTGERIRHVLQASLETGNPILWL